MKHRKVVIVGGGPAGSVCAWRLVQAGVDTLVLDKQSFPRSKTCAGWITPQVLQMLDFQPEEYPHSLSIYDGLKIYLDRIPVWKPGRQYAVRREEFDTWLLERSWVDFEVHDVRHIKATSEGFDVDDVVSAEYLVGAGGTYCPVYHQLFKDDKPRTGTRIVALEDEFACSWRDGKPRLWFFRRGLPGYAWYLPKAGGYLNLGVGGNARQLQERGTGITEHWQSLLADLKEKGLIQDQDFQPRGYIYQLQDLQPPTQTGKAYLVGDAVGLATLDMGEGIGPAVESGLRAAESILTGKTYSLQGIRQYSLLPSWLGDLFL